MSVSNLSDFTPRQRRYIEWRATPRFKRVPATQEMVALEIGVSDRTLRRWQKLDGFEEAVLELSRRQIRDAIGTIYGALVREAEKGSFQHIRLIMEMLGEYTERQELTGAGGGEVRVRVVRASEYAGDD